MTQKHLMIVMGVSGCGKTTIAKHLSERLSFKYMEADDFHSVENKQHMRSGFPLTDDMRRPWIRDICDAIRTDNQDIVLANSGLKSAHRASFCELERLVSFIHLKASQNIIKTRLNERTGHFMPAELLDSQFRDMEAPLAGEPVYGIDGSGSIKNVKATALNCAQVIISKTNKDISSS